MEAPDKIYIREYPDGIARFWEEKKKEDVVATIPHEYIRKDALIELINYELMLHATVEEISYCDMIIDKINSL